MKDRLVAGFLPVSQRRPLNHAAVPAGAALGSMAGASLEGLTLTIFWLFMKTQRPGAQSPVLLEDPSSPAELLSAPDQFTHNSLLPASVCVMAGSILQGANPWPSKGNQEIAQGQIGARKRAWQ